MEVESHLALASQNATLSQRLSQADDEAYWRWATVVAFYAAHHLVHALFATHPNELPSDIVRRGAARPEMVSFVHPDRHGLEPGGSRQSLLLLSRVFDDLQPLNSTYRSMLAASYEARYGLNGRTMTRVTRAMAEASRTNLSRLQSLINPHLG